MAKHLRCGISDPRACTKCGVEQPAENFYRRSATARRRECSACWTRAIKDRYPDGRGAPEAAKRRWVASNPEKRAAHIQVGNAIRDGKIGRQPCEVCGQKAHAHHDDYSKPLDVRWLCALHHRRYHASVQEVSAA